MFGRLTVTVATVAMALALPVAADSGPDEGNFYISPLGTYYGTPNDLGYKGSSIGYGGALGWSFKQNWAAEVSLFSYDADVDVPGGNSADITSVWGNILYLVPVESHLQPYVTFGGGRGKYEFGAPGTDKKINEYNLGVGAFYGLSDRISMRGDVRGVYLHDNNDDVRPFASLGVAVKLGKLEPKVLPDADGDGVPDASDKCPGTPAGRRVDATGCEFDADSDGVVDGADACPNTPAGVAVDSRGCPPDSDGDGVPDYLDQCPNTPRGTKVDAKGCPIVVAEPVTFDLTVEFAYDSAVINDLSFRELRRAMQFLRDHPSTKAVIEGHTDSRGADDYNQNLSTRRAAAVVDVLSKSGIDVSRLRSVGYGESRPVASNDTDEGRQRNRRVAIVVSE